VLWSGGQRAVLHVMEQGSAKLQ